MTNTQHQLRVAFCLEDSRAPKSTLTDLLQLLVAAASVSVLSWPIAQSDAMQAACMVVYAMRDCPDNVMRHIM
jgi:hypothetical protein